MGMEVGVATALVAGQGGRKKEGGGHKTNRDTETTYSKEKGPHCLCVCARVCVCVRVQSLCNNVQRAAAEMRPRFCRLTLRSRTVYARTSSPAFSSDFTTWG